MTNQDLFNTVYRHLLTQGVKAIDPQTEKCLYRGPNGTKCAIGCLIPDDRYFPALEGRSVSYNDLAAKAAGIDLDQINLAVELQVIHDSYPVAEWDKRLQSVARRNNLTIPVLEPVAPVEPIRVAPRTRLERLRSLSSNGSISIQTVARILDCPEASVRRDIFHLRQAGYVVTLERGQIRCDGLRKDLANG